MDVFGHATFNNYTPADCRLEILLFNSFSKITVDKVLYEEMMTNDDNLESNLLTFSFIENM